MIKSSRHSKITGDFAEHLVLYWLSCHGFECARIDHVGIDLIARNPTTDELMGVSVKARSRNVGKERTSLVVRRTHFDKVRTACDAFACVPCVAFVIDAAHVISGYILTVDHLFGMASPGTETINWAMSPNAVKRYEEDDEIRHFELRHEIRTWW